MHSCNLAVMIVIWLPFIVSSAKRILKQSGLKVVFFAQYIDHVQMMQIGFELYVTTPYVQRLQCGTWTDWEAVIACRSKQVILILFMAIKM